MDDLPFLDTNVVLRHLLGDHSDHSPRATAFLRRVERGELTVWSADTVVMETLFVLERSYRYPKGEVRDAVLSVFMLDRIHKPNRRRVEQALETFVSLNIPYADAYHAALMAELGSTRIVSFDRDFDRVPGVHWMEP